jgi:hypothetical protein
MNRNFIHVGHVAQNMAELVKLDISGKNPAAHARRILDQYDDVEDISSITIQINTPDKEGSGGSVQVPTSAFTEEGESKSGTETSSTDESSPKEQTTEEREAQKEEKRKKGTIKPNTSHHRVLHKLAELGKSGKIPGSEVKEKVTGVSDSSVYPALTQLWERMLVDRERVDDVANPYYKYELTDFGHQQLEELGEPQEDE